MAPQVVVMGVSGAGKSTVGAALATRLGVPFVDADDLHPPSNVEKMSAGIPLDDEDRRPWLAEVGAWLAARPAGGVTACSALRRRYRDQVRRHAPEVVFLLLDGDPETIRHRQAGRSGHFMPAGLLDSQLDTLERLAPDELGLTVDVGRPVAEIVATFLRWARDADGPSAGSPPADQ